MNTQEQIDIIREAQEHLAQAEQLISHLGNGYLNSYVCGHINASGTYLGDGLWNILEEHAGQLEAEEEAVEATARQNGEAEGGDRT